MLEGQPFVAELEGSRFRGEFLQCCAQIEHHLCAALDRLTELGEIKKSPYLFGQKFVQVLKSASVAGVWKHKDHVEAVLRDLQVFVELRGTLGHAVMTVAAVNDEAAVSWLPPGSRNWADRQTITLSEMKTVLEDLRRLTDKFLRQPLAPCPNPASSPPRPSPGAAGGP